ncbi:polysaccharide deacetylase family protein [Patescibacteria group bacterium]
MLKKTTQQGSILVIAILFIAIAIVVFGGWYWWQHRSFERGRVISSRYEPTELLSSNRNLFPGVQIETLEEQWDEYVIAAQYPGTENNEVDQHVFAFVRQRVNSFMEQALDRPSTAEWRDEMQITFATFGLAPNLLSVKFDVNEYFSDNANSATNLITKAYDLNSGKELRLADFFETDEDYLTKLSDLGRISLEADDDVADKSLIENAIAPKPNNFKAFTFDEDSLTIYIPAGKVSSYVHLIDIPYSQLQSSLAPLITDHFESDEAIANASSRINEINSPTEPIVAPEIKIESSVETCLNPVALTFDDGPHRDHTVQELKILREKNVVGSFFLLGNQVIAYPGLVNLISEEGHELGNHSWDHAQLTRLGAVGVQDEISKTQEAIKNATGVEPILFRPPYGLNNKTVQDQAGMAVIMWSIDPQDWRYRDTETVINKVVDKTKTGDIILLHSTHQSTVDAIPEIIDKLREKGYCFVKVSELLGLHEDPAVSAGQVFRKRPE